MIKPYYEEDGITIYNAPCEKVLPQLEKADLVLTDPPYAIAAGIVADRPTKWQRRAGKQTEEWDNATQDETVLSLLQMAPKVVVWGGNYYPLPPSRGWLTWFKPDAPPSMASVELAWTNQNQNARQISHSISATNAERVGHPTQKPLAVMKWSIKQMKNVGGILLDPYCGSGTSLVAARWFGMRAIGIEINEAYCRIAVERLRQRSLFAA